MRRDLKFLIYVPSFYGFITFTFFYISYILGIIEYNECNNYSHFIFIISALFFFVSSFLYLKLYKNRIVNDFNFYSSLQYLDINKIKRFIFVFYSLGNIGFIMYLVKLISYFGGVSFFLGMIFSDDSKQIRIEGDNFSDSIGIQLSYFSWLAVSISLCVIKEMKSKKIYYLFILITFFENLLFIDRTRPIWIIFTSLIAILPFVYHKINNFKIIFYSLFFMIVVYGLFSAIAILAGKDTDEKMYKGWNISPSAQSFVYYGTSSFAYFNHIIENENIDELNIDRTMYPLLKITNSLGLTEEPSSLINEFYFIPSPTNVGTFLEPFYRDGGFLYVMFAIFLHSFLLNSLGLFFLRGANPFGLYAYSNVCYVNLMAFFTPKINNFPIWLFLMIGVYFMISTKKKYKFK
ncbi:O-antigen polymerase [Flavobacterium columnare]|nr:O-antigen polymerase [Flavobacterium columnare]